MRAVEALSRALRPFLLALSCALLAPGPLFAGGLEEYRRELAAAERALVEGGASPTQIAARLRAVGAIEVTGGPAVVPDLGPVLKALEATPPDQGAALAGLRAILDATEQPAALPVPPERAASVLQQVLVEETPRSARDGLPPWLLPVLALVEDAGRWLAGAVDAALRWLAGLLKGAGEATGLGGRLPGFLVPLLGLLLVVAVVWAAVLGVRRSFGPGAVRLQEEAAAPAVTAESERAEAAGLAAEGAFREALRHLYLATLLSLDEQGLLRLDRALTNREVLARVRARGEASLLPALEPLVDAFDRVWYGGAPCSEEEYAALTGLAARARGLP